MGKVVLNRVDYRLAHGQICHAWARSKGAKKVVVIDEATAKDKLALVTMQAGLGANGTKVVAYSVEKAVEKWKEDKFGNGNIIVIFRDIAHAKQAFDLGYDYTQLNVGQVPMAEGRRKSVATICLSDEEMDILTELNNKGVEVYNHQTPTDTKHDYNEIAKSMGR